MKPQSPQSLSLPIAARQDSSTTHSCYYSKSGFVKVWLVAEEAVPSTIR